ncbi:hypothetical protein ACYOEI_37125, partial [Singulisphaera rosea]
MGRRASFHWDKREQAYRTETGGKTKYFRGIAREDHSGIANAFATYLEDLDAATRPIELTAEDIATAFVKAGRGVKARTVRTHKERLVAWMEWDPKDGGGIIAGRPVSSLEAKHLRKALSTWAEEGLSDNYRAGICRSVKAAFTWATSEEGGRLVASNPFAEVKVPSVGRSPIRYAERKEAAAFLRYTWRRADESVGVYRRFG